MKKYAYPLVPGPTTVPKKFSKLYKEDVPSSDSEDDFFTQYSIAQEKVKRLLNAQNAGVAIMSGEAMVALWGGMKSILKPKDKVLAVSTGLYGEGFGEMAAELGANVEYVKFEWNEAALDIERIRRAALEFKPNIITVVHCETPSGIVNPIDQIGVIAKEVGSLYYVDFVSSGGGIEIRVDDWNIDIGLLGTQKCLNLPPDLGIVTISNRAWEVIDTVNYVGYDALKPFKTAVAIKFFPYTHNWRAVSALVASLESIEAAGPEQMYGWHIVAKQYTIERIKAMGLSLWAVFDDISSPTVTAVTVPDGWTWKQLDSALRASGVCFGGSYGKLEGKVFRIGHMGCAADLKLLEPALDILQKVIERGPNSS